MTLGSLFDGIGGFPLAGSWCGMKPLWASEIEKNCVSITRRRFPEMKHLGSVTEIKGGEIPPVDVITFGSPCQGLSIAGRCGGLEDNRSGLFLEAVRIIREMREATHGRYPAFAVWENVPGAFSSNQSEDFRRVLEELCRTADPEVSIPGPGKKGWNSSGTVVGDDFSLAWRVLDARFWGVPQRRKRIYLVLCFGRQCAGEILFKPESPSGNHKKGEKPWEKAAGNLGACAYPSIARALTHRNDGGPCIDRGPDIIVQAYGFCGQSSAAAGLGFEREVSPTLRAAHPPHAALLFDCHAQDSRFTGAADTAQTVAAHWGTGGNNAPLIVSLQDVAGVDWRNGKEASELCGTIQSGSTGTSLNTIPPVRIGLAVRRLTPLECERLQGYPDNWTLLGENGKEISDSARYRALGNSLALPCAYRVLSGIAEYMEKEEGHDRQNQPEQSGISGVYSSPGKGKLCWNRLQG